MKLVSPTSRSLLMLLPMTGYTVHTGSSKKFAQGWDQIFQGKAAPKSAKPVAKKATQKKPTAKKSASGKTK